MLLGLLTAVALAGPYEPAEQWLPGTLGALPPPWSVAVSQDEALVAVLDGSGRVTLAEADTLAVRAQVSVAPGDASVLGRIVFGPEGLAVAAGPRDDAVRVAVIDVDTGVLTPLGRAPEGSSILDLQWLEGGRVRTWSREPDPTSPIDGLYERTWGPSPYAREVAAWTPVRRVEARRSDRVFVDATTRSLDRGGNVVLDVRFQVWDRTWDPTSARALRDCPEWSEVVHVSDDGRLAYTMGQVRCVYDLDTGEVVAWETEQVPFWSRLSPDGSRVVERHGKGGRRYGVVRDTRNGNVTLELEDLEGARFTNDAGLLVWTSHRLTLRNLADGSVRWSLPLDGEVLDVRMSPDARTVALVERLAAGGRARIRVFDADGAVRAVINDVSGLRGFSDGGRRMLVDVRGDHLGVVDLRAPESSGPLTHRASVGVVHVDDQGAVLSGDDEGRVRRAVGSRVQAWQVEGEVRDLAWADDTVTALCAADGAERDDPVRWRMPRWTLDGGPPRKASVVAEGARYGRILGSDALLFGPGAPLRYVGGRGKGKPVPAWGSRDDAGPDPATVVVMPGRDRIAGVPDSASATRALAWGFSRKNPVGSYPLGLGRPALLAAGERYLAVLDARGAGRSYPLDGGGGAVDLAVMDGSNEPCCAAVGGSVLAVATSRGVVQVYDATTGDRVQVLDPGFVADLSAVAVSPNGDFIVAGSAGGELASFRR